MKNIDKNELHSIFAKIRNDNNSVEELYKKYNKLVKNISFSIVKNDDISEEISQTVFLKILQLPNEKLPTNHEANWLYTVTKNQTMEYLRRKKTHIDIDSLYNIEDNNNEINKIIDIETYNNIINRLNPTEQEIVSLKIFTKLTFKEIGQILNIPMGTVQWKYYKAINTLKLLISNFMMFIITFVLYIKNSIPQKSSISLPNNSSHNSMSIDSINPSMTDAALSGSDVSLNITNIQSLLLLCISVVFFTITIILLINFIKYQQKGTKKASK